MDRLNQFSTLKIFFENQNFEMFEKVAHNFGKSDGDIIQWFYAQLEQKILDGI